MASYQNTSEYYCGATMDTYPGNCSYTSIYYNQHPEINPTDGACYSSENFQTNQEPRPSLIYDPPQRQIIYKPVSSYPLSYQEPRPYPSNSCMAKRHRAQISILPSSHGSFKATLKCKRNCTMFTTEQVQALEDIFKTKHYISREERQVIVNNLQLRDKAVKLWFQNRRLKAKRLQNHDSEEREHFSDCSSDKSSLLDAVESEIIKKTDDNGLVALDDGMMRELGSIIDACLTKNHVEVPEEAPIYEAVSPASGVEEDSFVSWRPPSDIEPCASFQRLRDLKTRCFCCNLCLVLNVNCVFLLNSFLISIIGLVSMKRF